MQLVMVRSYVELPQSSRGLFNLLTSPEGATILDDTTSHTDPPLEVLKWHDRQSLSAISCSCILSAFEYTGVYPFSYPCAGTVAEVKYLRRCTCFVYTWLPLVMVLVLCWRLQHQILNFNVQSENRPRHDWTSVLQEGFEGVQDLLHYTGLKSLTPRPSLPSSPLGSALS